MPEETEEEKRVRLKAALDERDAAARRRYLERISPEQRAEEEGGEDE